MRGAAAPAGSLSREGAELPTAPAQPAPVRIGSALLYLLDYIAASDLARAATAAAHRGAGLFTLGGTAALPEELLHPGQDSSVIVRMKGSQPIADTPQAVAGAVSRHGRPYLTCQLGGLVLVSCTTPKPSPA